MPHPLYPTLFIQKIDLQGHTLLALYADTLLSLAPLPPRAPWACQVTDGRRGGAGARGPILFCTSLGPKISSAKNEARADSSPL